MGRNKAVSMRIAEKLKKLPGAVHAAGLETAIFTLPAHTHQDSGRAAFNWQAQAGKSTARVYIPTRGVPPVGERMDGRSGTGSTNAVSIYRAKEAQTLLSVIRDGGIKSSTISNPIEQSETGASYVDNAKLKQALDNAKAEIEISMRDEVKLWHRTSRSTK